MSDALSAAADLLRAIPLKARRAVYGLYGLVILVEPIVDVLPEEVDLRIIAGFGLFTTLMALANSSTTSAPPSPPLHEGAPEQFPNEFP